MRKKGKVLRRFGLRRHLVEIGWDESSTGSMSQNEDEQPREENIHVKLRTDRSAQIFFATKSLRTPVCMDNYSVGSSAASPSSSAASAAANSSNAATRRRSSSSR